MDWVQAGQGVDGEAAGDWFGCALAVSADEKRLAIGAICNDGIGDDAGHVRVPVKRNGLGAGGTRCRWRSN
jgi:hypothetical protein